jgi:hypothetical protein
MRARLKPSLVKYRNLDIDDLVILKMIGEGRTYADIRRTLGVTAPAISHRLRKYAATWDGFLMSKPLSYKGVRIPSAEAQRIIAVATRAWEVLTSEVHISSSDSSSSM